MYSFEFNFLESGGNNFGRLLDLQIKSYVWSVQKNKDDMIKYSAMNISWVMKNKIFENTSTIYIYMKNLVGDNHYNNFPRCKSYNIYPPFRSQVKDEYFYDCLYMLSHGTTQPLLYYVQINLAPSSITKYYYVIIPDVKYIDPIQDPMQWQTTLYYFPYTLNLSSPDIYKALVEVNFQWPFKHLIKMKPILSELKSTLWISFPSSSIFNYTIFMSKFYIDEMQELLLNLPNYTNKHAHLSFTQINDAKLSNQNYIIRNFLNDAKFSFLPLASKVLLMRKRSLHSYTFKDLFSHDIYHQLWPNNVTFETFDSAERQSANGKEKIRRWLKLLSTNCYGFVTIKPLVGGTYVSSLAFEILPDHGYDVDRVVDLIWLDQQARHASHRDSVSQSRGYVIVAIVLGIALVLATLFILRSFKKKFASSPAKHPRVNGNGIHSRAPSVLVVYSRLPGLLHCRCVESFARLIEIHYDCDVMLDLWDLGKGPFNPGMWLERHMNRCQAIIIVLTNEMDDIEHLSLHHRQPLLLSNEVKSKDRIKSKNDRNRTLLSNPSGNDNFNLKDIDSKRVKQSRDVREMPWPDLLQPCLDIMKDSSKFDLGPFATKAILVNFEYLKCEPNVHKHHKTPNILSQCLGLPLKMASEIPVINIEGSDVKQALVALWKICDTFVNHEEASLQHNNVVGKDEIVCLTNAISKLDIWQGRKHSFGSLPQNVAHLQTDALLDFETSFKRVGNDDESERTLATPPMISTFGVTVDEGMCQMSRLFHPPLHDLLNSSLRSLHSMAVMHDDDGDGDDGVVVIPSYSAMKGEGGRGEVECDVLIHSDPPYPDLPSYQAMTGATL